MAATTRARTGKLLVIAGVAGDHEVRSRDQAQPRLRERGVTGRRRAYAVRGPVLRPGRRGEFGEHAVGGEETSAVLAGEFAHGLDLRVQICAPLLSLLLSDERGTGLDDPGYRQQERLDRDQFRARLGEGREQAVFSQVTGLPG
ncbi:hypothetical protein Sviol_51700 [Streptomyces violascens]|uniref:Uncharacterized protein n=1 Tax=Streptomyces violascens TaxID=67381 RepID=A0ABQ3QTZ9_9ACTN|nr:hypothetical protein Sviol_51700 [Streptomyces violascens]